jgi:hypothetical protein
MHRLKYKARYMYIYAILKQRIDGLFDELFGLSSPRSLREVYQIPQKGLSQGIICIHCKYIYEKLGFEVDIKKNICSDIYYCFFSSFSCEEKHLDLFFIHVL